MNIPLTLKLSNLLGPISRVPRLTWTLANKIWMLFKWNTRWLRSPAPSAVIQLLLHRETEPWAERAYSVLVVIFHWLLSEKYISGNILISIDAHAFHGKSSQHSVKHSGLFYWQSTSHGKYRKIQSQSSWSHDTLVLGIYICVHILNPWVSQLFEGTINDIAKWTTSQGRRRPPPDFLLW